MRFIVRGFLLVAVAGTFLPAMPASAYVRTKTADALPYFWNRNHVVITAHVGDPPSGLTRDEVVNAVKGAAKAWSHESIACTGLRLEVVTDPAPSALAENDLTNHLTFRRQRWCKEPLMAGEACYPASTLAVTSTSVRTLDGILVDADIEVNAVDFKWNDLILRPEVTGAMDLQNTLTHEIGHLLGFDHTCHVPGWPVGIDDLGRTVPECTAATPETLDATMAPAATEGDIIRRTLAKDDINAVCAVYPNIPDGTVEGGCSMIPGRFDRGFPLVLALGFALGAGLRLRARHGPSRYARPSRPPQY